MSQQTCSSSSHKGPVQLESELRNAYERIATQDAAIRHLTMRLRTMEAQLAAYHRVEDVRARFDAESA